MSNREDEILFGLGLGDTDYKKPTERAPLLLSEDEVDAILDKDEMVCHPQDAFQKGVDAAQKALEAKITSGELRVVKKVRGVPTDNGEYAYHCGYLVSDAWGYKATFCPGCGAQIVK